MSGASIPQELVDELVNHFFDDRPQLRYFLATCTSFASRARYHLYRTLRIVTLRHLSGFLELCQAIPEIPILVRALTIHPVVPHLNERATLQLFDLLKSLASLTIICYVCETGDDKLVAIARGLPLTTLTFERAHLFPRVDEFASLIRGNAQLKTLCLGQINLASKLGIDPFSRLERPNSEQRIETLCLLTCSALGLVLGYSGDCGAIPDPDANYTLIAMEPVQRVIISFETFSWSSVIPLLRLASNLRELIIAQRFPSKLYPHDIHGLLGLDLSRIPIIKVEAYNPECGSHLVSWLLTPMRRRNMELESTNTQEITFVLVLKDVSRPQQLIGEWDMVWFTLDVRWRACSWSPMITIIITNGDHSGDIFVCGTLFKQAIEAACPHVVSRERLNVHAVKRGNCKESFLYSQEVLQEH